MSLRTKIVLWIAGGLLLLAGGVGLGIWLAPGPAPSPLVEAVQQTERIELEHKIRVDEIEDASSKRVKAIELERTRTIRTLSSPTEDPDGRQLLKRIEELDKELPQ